MEMKLTPSQRFVYNDREEWGKHEKKICDKRFQIIAALECEDLANRLQQKYPDRFCFHPTKWEKFPDGTDKIQIGGFQPHNVLAGEHILFLASFHDNDVTLSQLQVMIALLESFIESLTIVLPYFPTGTMERVTVEGQVATANTYSMLLSNLPSCGRPNRLMVYDLHTLQNRFYIHGNTLATLHTTVPVLLQELLSTDIDCIAFPDDGAAKRFGHMFKQFAEIVVCGKIRDGDERRVTIQDGNPEGMNVLIVDDLVQTGGTLYECGKALRARGAKTVSAFVAHGVFPRNAWTKFAQGADRCCFEKFYLTNSIPTTIKNLPSNDVFVVLDIMDQIVEDLVCFSR